MKIECWKLAMYIWDEMSTADVRLQPNDCFKIGLCFHLWFERKSALWNCWINIAAIIHTHTQCPTVILVQMKVNVMIYVLCTSQAWLLFCLNCTEIMVKGWICALNVMPSNIHTLCCYPFTHCLKICLIFLRENRQDWPCTCFFVCIGTSSCLCECLQPSVCQLLLLISAGEVASVLSSDKALTLRVKECEPGAVTIKTFPWGGQCWTPQQTG